MKVTAANMEQFRARDFELAVKNLSSFVEKPTRGFWCLHHPVTVIEANRIANERRSTL